METFVTLIAGVLLVAACVLAVAVVLWGLYLCGLVIRGVYLLLHSALGVLLLPFGVDILSKEVADGSQPSPAGTAQRR